MYVPELWAIQNNTVNNGHVGTRHYRGVGLSSEVKKIRDIKVCPL